MRRLIFTAGILTTMLGFVADERLGDPALFQGALTLGGGWIICGLFSYHSKWHGIIGAAVLGLLGASRCAPNLLSLGNPDAPAAPFQAIAFLICIVVLISAVRLLKAERAKRQIEELKNAADGD